MILFSEYEEVRIKSTGIVGTIVDVTQRNGIPHYVVESSISGPLPGGYGDKWPLFDCDEGDIEEIKS